VTDRQRDRLTDRPTDRPRYRPHSLIGTYSTAMRPNGNSPSRRTAHPPTPSLSYVCAKRPYLPTSAYGKQATVTVFDKSIMAWITARSHSHCAIHHHAPCSNRTLNISVADKTVHTDASSIVNRSTLAEQQYMIAWR